MKTLPAPLPPVPAGNWRAIRNRREEMRRRDLAWLKTARKPKRDPDPPF